jgi:hypothetical protein
VACMLSTYAPCGASHALTSGYVREHHVHRTSASPLAGLGQASKHHMLRRMPFESRHMTSGITPDVM